MSKNKNNDKKGTTVKFAVINGFVSGTTRAFITYFINKIENIFN
ncbi:hypothetical protein [Peribacillus butanolivorans]